MSCLADEVVAAWLDGALAEQERAMAIEHTSGCDPCRELVGAMFDSERVPVTIGRYEVVGSIGGGGMGVVLRGRDPVLDRSVAIKLARVGQGDQAQMLREAQALARLSHPNVVAVYDFGESGGEVFVAMALVEGLPLSRWLAESHSSIEKLRVLDGVAAGLAAIHDANLVHRDIKPDNVVVRENGEVVIVDFGLARPSASGAAGTGVAGTRHYVAPEVIAGGAATPASDQYAWWILVDEVLGAHPRVDAVRARGMSNDRFRDMRAAAQALQRAVAPRWRVPVAIGTLVVIAAATGYVATRGGEDPCAWAPTAWHDQRAAVGHGLEVAGIDVPRVMGALDKRATATATARRDACMLARSDGADDRAFGQYRVACVDRTWADAMGHLRALGSAEREEVWSALDQLGLVLDPARCAKASRATVAPAALDPNAEVTRLGRELVAIAREPSLDTATRLARIDAMEPAVMAMQDVQLAARWHVLRAEALVKLGRFEESAAALDRGDLAAESSGDDDLRLEIAIDRVMHAYVTAKRDTAALEARAAALVDKLDNPVRRAELADARGVLLAARDDLPGAVASLREAVAIYDELSLDASERAGRALQNLGAALQLAGDLPAAGEVFDKGLAVTRRRFGEAAANTFEMRGARATNLLYAGRAEEARRELALVVDGLAKVAGPGDSALGMAHLMLCQAEKEAMVATAVERCRAALAHAEAAFGKDHAQLVGYLTAYGDALRVTGRVKEAIEVLDHAVKIGEGGTVSAAELGFAQALLALAQHTVNARDPRALALGRTSLTTLRGRPEMARVVKELEAAFP